ncbi:MAG: NACHT domain-containing protein, partial [Trebonia sp.]
MTAEDEQEQVGPSVGQPQVDIRQSSGVQVGGSGLNLQVNNFGSDPFYGGPVRDTAGTASLALSITIYLERLIQWLATDPWPSDSRFGGPSLKPAAIEQKLRILTDDGSQGEEYADADDLSGRCVRLVVLGGPGSGKSWLARRAARQCAEAALDALAAGALPDDVELPLYTTCARLLSVLPGEGFRHAVVASALGQLPDLGGSDAFDAVRELFEARTARTLLVTDSLDEAHGADDRIRQLDTLPTAWRVILTSRPASWQHQLSITGKDATRRVVELQPLRYPDDVEPFISGWFIEQPTQAGALITQLRNRPALQKAATVPLILAFFCILSADESLPENRADLYAKVIRRMLTGHWRGARSPSDSVDFLGILREWAWSAASSDPASGIGAWKDDFPTCLDAGGREALDHVAVPAPLTPADVDLGVTRRRFVHRVLQEHLVAEYVARMPATRAADELVRHLWYDRDWEYAAPAALAMHPEHSLVLMALMRRAAKGRPVSRILDEVDGCWELRRFLARVALESCEDDAWTPDAVHLIQQARLDLAESADPRDLGIIMTAEWPTSNRLILQSLLAELPEACLRGRGDELAEAIGALGPTQEELASGREALLGLLPYAVDRWQPVRAAAKLRLTTEEMTKSRQALLSTLSGNLDSRDVCMTVELIAELNPSAQESARARRAVLAHLANQWDPYQAIRLSKIITWLGATPEDLAKIRAIMLALLTKVFDLEPSSGFHSVKFIIRAMET